MLRNKYVKGGLLMGLTIGMWSGTLLAQVNWFVPMGLGYIAAIATFWVVKP